MATREQLSTALRNAHNAGDTDAARRIAGMIKAADRSVDSSAPQGSQIPDVVGPAKQTAPSAKDRFKFGMMDPLEGGAQLMAHAMPDAMREAMNKIPGINAASAEEMDRDIRGREGLYKARRGEDPGFDLARMGGNITTMAPTMLANPTTIAGGALWGALTGATMPVADENFGRGKLMQSGTGALGGGVGTGATNMFGKLINPGTAQNALSSAGVRLTPGQALGGAAKTMEQKLTSVPFVGDMIKNAQGRSIRDFNRLTYDYVLEPLGKKFASKSVGHKGVAELSDKLGDFYDDVLPRLSFNADQPFADAVGDVLRAAPKRMGKHNAKRLRDIVDNIVLERLDMDGSIAGRDMKQIQSALSKRVNSYAASTDPDARQLGEALDEIRKSMRDTITRQNPQYGGVLKNLDKAYARYRTIEDAAKAIGAKNGVFSPKQFAGSVRMGRGGTGKRQWAKGRGFGQDMAELATDVIGDVYPDSGTAGRIMAGGLTAGAGAMEPMSLAGLAALGSLYAPGVSTALGRGLASRPQFMEPIARGIGRGAPLGGLTGAMYGQESRR